MNAQCIMVCSGKGGTGKSTVSVLLGACLARLGRKTLLVELDSGLRSVDIIAGVYARCTPGCPSSAPRMRAARWRRPRWDVC